MDSFDNSEPDEDYNEGKSSSEMNNLLENTDSDVLRADGRGFDGFDRLENESKKYDRFGSKYETLMEKHIETQDELNTEIRAEHERVIEEYGDVLDLIDDLDQEYDELNQEYKELMKKYENAADRLIYTLDDFSEAERSSGIKDVIQGSVLFGAGILSADQYSFGGAFDFYANAASNYANEPETAILTLGLPLIGAWYFKNALGSWNNSRELDNASDTWKHRRSKMKGEKQLEDMKDPESSKKDKDDIDVIDNE